MKVTAIVGTYRKGGMIDQAVDAVLSGAAENGAETRKIYLIDQHIEFCTNCRTCTQTEGPKRGPCPLKDDMGAILDELDASDALVLASPMNFWTVTAVMKRFIERLVCLAYWPWGAYSPKNRNVELKKRAVLVASSAAPALLARLMTRMVGLMKNVSTILGAKNIGTLFIGIAGHKAHPALSARNKEKARKLGRKLVGG